MNEGVCREGGALDASLFPSESLSPFGRLSEPIYFGSHGGSPSRDGGSTE